MRYFYKISYLTGEEVCYIYRIILSDRKKGVIFVPEILSLSTYIQSKTVIS